MPLNSLALIAAKTGLTIFEIFNSQKKAYSEKSFEEEMLIRSYQKLSFKYFVNFHFIPKLFLKV